MMNNISLDLNYIVRACETAILSGNKNVQLSSVNKEKEPAHFHPNIRTKAYYLNLETNEIHYGQENGFRNESGYDFWKNGLPKKGRDAVIDVIFENLVENGKFSDSDIERKNEIRVAYNRIAKMLEIKRQEKMPSTAKPLFK